MFQTPGNQVHYLTVALDGAAGYERTRVHHRPVLTLRHPRPDHEVDLTGLVFEGNEDHPTGG